MTEVLLVTAHGSSSLMFAHDHFPLGLPKETCRERAGRLEHIYLGDFAMEDDVSIPYRFDGQLEFLSSC